MQRAQGPHVAGLEGAHRQRACEGGGDGVGDGALLRLGGQAGDDDVGAQDGWVLQPCGNDAILESQPGGPQARSAVVVVVVVAPRVLSAFTGGREPHGASAQQHEAEVVDEPQRRLIAARGPHVQGPAQRARHSLGHGFVDDGSDEGGGDLSVLHR